MTADIVKTEFLDFICIPTNGKTKLYQVCTKQADVLGHIKWYGPWRKYVFYPQGQTIFDAKCLRCIIDFITRLMDDRKKIK